MRRRHPSEQSIDNSLSYWRACWLPCRLDVIRLSPLFPAHPQVFSAVGAAILLFESVVKPRFVQQISIRTSQRWGSISASVIILVVPFMSRLHGTGPPLIATSLVIIFSIQACANAVRHHTQPTSSDLPHSTLFDVVCCETAVGCGVMFPAFARFRLGRDS